MRRSAVILAGAAVVALADPAGAAALPAWKKVPIPALGPNSHLDGVKAFSGKDAWAVGAKGPDGVAVVLRWNGRKWSESKAIGNHFRNARMVAGTSGSDIWVTGSCTTPWGDLAAPCTANWNGKGWSTFILPQPADGISVKAISVVSRTDAWIAGNSGRSAYFLHWNGRQWSPVRSPNPAGRQFWINSIVAVGAKNVWATGVDNTESDRPVFLHWNGTAWTIAASGQVAGGSMATITALPKGRLMAAGTAGGAKSLVAAYDGKVWRTSPAPALPSTLTFSLAGDGGGGIWAGTEVNPSTRSVYGHWDGKKWTNVQGGTYASKDAVAALSLALVPKTKSVWAVGRYNDAAKGYQAFIEINGPLPH